MYTPRDTMGLCVCVYTCVFEREAQRDGVPIDWEGDRDTTRPYYTHVVNEVKWNISTNWTGC